MPVTFVKDDYRTAVEAASGGKQTVLYDDLGQPSIMTIIPKFNIEDVAPAGVSMGSGVHPAFIVGGKEKDKIFIAAHLAITANSRAVSIPGRPPANYVTYDQAVSLCASKGQGWHLMTNWEWAALMLWCQKNGYQPRGNTNWRRAHDATYETGAAVDGRAPGVTTGDGRTMTGSGPVSWKHDNTPHGVSDMVGNVWEWQGGLKLIRGRIYMPNDNDYTMAEASWPAQDVYLDASAGPGDGEGAVQNGTPILSNAISKFSENPDTAAALDLDYTHVSAWKDTGISTGYNGLTAAIRQRMLQAGIAPKFQSGDSAGLTLQGGLWVRNYGERMPVRGGNWGNGAAAGLGALDLGSRRSGSGSGVGFRPAFIS
jgi:formylglycine-generating enzyme required for sulfatase activity